MDCFARTSRSLVDLLTSAHVPNTDWFYASFLKPFLFFLVETAARKCTSSCTKVHLKNAINRKRPCRVRTCSKSNQSPLHPVATINNQPCKYPSLDKSTSPHSSACRRKTSHDIADLLSSHNEVLLARLGCVVASMADPANAVFAGAKALLCMPDARQQLADAAGSDWSGEALRYTARLGVGRLVALRKPNGSVRVLVVGDILRHQFGLSTCAGTEAVCAQPPRLPREPRCCRSMPSRHSTMLRGAPCWARSSPSTNTWLDDSGQAYGLWSSSRGGHLNKAIRSA